MYRVVKFFTDLQDRDHPYHVGDAFPRDGVEVTKERVKELSGKENKQGVPLIEYVEDEVLEQKSDPEEISDEKSTVQEKAEQPAKKRASRKKAELNSIQK